MPFAAITESNALNVAPHRHEYPGTKATMLLARPSFSISAVTIWKARLLRDRACAMLCLDVVHLCFRP